MRLSRDAFAALVAPDGPEVSITLYHECLHSIAFTHAKTLGIPRYKFIDPASPLNVDGTTTVHFLPQWRSALLLPLFLRLLHLYLKPQLRLTDDNFLQISAAFEGLPTADLTDILGLSLKQLGHHLHIIHSITLLEQLCQWNVRDTPLDYFIHLGGNPMIILGDILIHDSVQHMVSCLIDHIRSLSLHRNCSTHESILSCSHTSHS